MPWGLEQLRRSERSMNRIRNTCLCALTGLSVFCTAACTRGPAQAFEPTEDSLYITGSGQVTSAAIETYEKDYYTEEGLKAFVEENLAAFNQDAASLAGDGEKAPAVLNACTLADGTASLLIDFSSPAAYMEFMAAYPDEESGVQVKALSILSMEEAELGDVSLTAAAGKEKGTAVPADQVKKKSKFHVAVVEGPALLETDGAIQYISDGVTLTGENGARTPDGGVSYIIFK
jgi:hypothetical protein